MKFKNYIFIKFIIAAIVFSEVCFLNIQNVKADSTIIPSKEIGIENSGSEIKVPLERDEPGDKNDKASRGAISKGSEVVNYAYKFLGKPYVYGAAGPNAFDCSGLTQYVYNRFGIDLSRTTYSQVNQGVKVDRSNLIAGDLVFFNTEGSISHVGIYIGNGEFIHAPRTGKPVMVSSLDDGYYAQKYATARRIFN